jgi:2-oxoisovalerate dehydrogenase E2 component (dihydrolipoyl transacylase)
MSVHEFRLPDVGEGLVEATIVRWLVAIGQTIVRGDPVLEIETAKSLVELPSPYDGELVELLVTEGDTVPVGTALFRVSEPAAAVGAAPDDSTTAGTQADRNDVLVGYGPGGSTSGRRRRRAQPATSAAPIVDVDPKPRAKPPVRKLAHNLGVDLGAVLPTGPAGTITREDVTGFVRERRPAAESDGNESRTPVSGVRRATAAAMCTSAFSAPHASLFHTVDVSRTVKLVNRLQNEPSLEGVKVTALTVVAAALLSAVRKYPDVNTSWDDATQEIVRYRHVNLGIAAAAPRGLLVPNVKGAETMSLRQLTEAILEITRRAKAGQATPQDMSGGTITITNVGVFGVDTGVPILNPGEAAILCLGAIRRLPWEHHGRVRLRWVTQLGLSFDHRLVDGELGARVLTHVGRVLENPLWELLID